MAGCGCGMIYQILLHMCASSSTNTTPTPSLEHRKSVSCSKRMIFRRPYTVTGTTLTRLVLWYFSATALVPYSPNKYVNIFRLSVICNAQKLQTLLNAHNNARYHTLWMATLVNLSSRQITSLIYAVPVWFSSAHPMKVQRALKWCLGAWLSELFTTGYLPRSTQRCHRSRKRIFSICGRITGALETRNQSI